MKLVVDTNVLFAFFWKNSPVREIIKEEMVELYSPELALRELKKYSSDIQRKAGISATLFEMGLKKLSSYVKFVPLEEYETLIPTAKSLAKEFSEPKFEEFLKDIDFIALALKLDVSILSEDKLLKQQTRVEVLTKSELRDKLQSS